MPAAKGEKGDEGRRGKKVEDCLILFLDFSGINKQSCLVRYGIKLKTNCSIRIASFMQVRHQHSTQCFGQLTLGDVHKRLIF